MVRFKWVRKYVNNGSVCAYAFKWVLIPGDCLDQSLQFSSLAIGFFLGLRESDWPKIT